MANTSISAEYDRVIKEANQRSELKFECPQDVEEIPVEEFKGYLDEIILQQINLNSYIQKREFELQNTSPVLLPRVSLSTKTAKQAVWGSGPYHIQGTFDYSKNPPHIENLRGLK